METCPSLPLSILLCGSFFCLIALTITLLFVILFLISKISFFVSVLKSFQNFIFVLSMVQYKWLTPSSVTHLVEVPTEGAELSLSLSHSMGRTSSHIPPLLTAVCRPSDLNLDELDKQEAHTNFCCHANLYLSTAFCFKFDWKPSFANIFKSLTPMNFDIWSSI